MRITIESDDNKKVSVEMADSSDIYDVMEAFTGELAIIGFHPDSIIRGHDAEAERLNELKGTCDADPE